MKTSFWLAYLPLERLLSAKSASAQSTTLTTAREVGKEGLAAYRAGESHVHASECLRAYGAVRVPSLAVFAAGAHAKSDKLVVERPSS